MSVTLIIEIIVKTIFIAIPGDIRARAVLATCQNARLRSQVNNVHLRILGY